MPKYLVKAKFTLEGVRGLMKGGGGTARRKAVKESLEGLGGKLEAFYFAFGETDVYVIGELPDNVAAAALSLAVNAAGGAQTEGTVLITAEEMDEAVKRQVKYRAPGQ
jgi:uncharacterized protein with GYD domain